MKIDKTVWKETLYVALGTLFLSVCMVLIYCAIKPFEVNVIYGAIFGGVAAVLNFFFMAYTLQKAVTDYANEEEKREEKVKLKVKSSYAVRSFVYLLSLTVAIITGFFNIYTLLIPALFPTMVAKVRMIWLQTHGEE